jgi:GTP-binding protein
MIINKAELYKIISDNTPPLKLNTPEVAMVGRSNVGKSSIINYLTGVSSLARTSKEPGKTQTINYYICNDGAFFFVDLPGYGFASISKEKKESWAKIIEDFLVSYTNKKIILLLLDIRRDISEKDSLMVQYLYYMRIPYTVVLTKADTLKKEEVIKARIRISSQLKIGIDNIHVVSSKEKVGKKELLDRLALQMDFVSSNK